MIRFKSLLNKLSCCHRQCIWIIPLSAALLFLGNAWMPFTNERQEQLKLRNKVLEMFQHAYSAYMTNAFPADELMPIACKGRIRGITPSRGDVDDILGNFSLTLVDSLDTLAVLGLYDEFEDAVIKVTSRVSFNADVMVSVFETIIRMLGGLLGGHSVALEIKEQHGRMLWYNNSLLELAKILGDKLLPAFNTTSGIPFSRINLHTGAVRKAQDKDTCTACAGTMLLEMAALSRYTGDPIYESCARRAMDYLWSRRQRSTDLMGTVLSIENGEWIRKESGVGAGIDSYYEYLMKGYIFLGDEMFLERFNTHYMAIKQYMNQTPLLIDVLMHKPTTSARHFVDALSAFWPGLQVLKGDVESAIKTHELLYQVFTRHTFLPEAFTTSFDIHWGQYPLRPEFAESTYLLYKATGDPHYVDVGKTIVENLEKRTRVKCGFAGIKDVRTFKHEDRMDSYFLAEMFKYLYLLFSPDHSDLGVNLDNYILTTEAHLLPLKLSLEKSHNNVSIEKVTSPVNAASNFERSCANSYYSQHGSSLAAKLRKEVNIGNKDVVTQPSKRILKAHEFIPGNKEHLDLLNKMGISIVMLPHGKIQLVQQFNSAHTTNDAAEGAVFMQEMIELSKSGPNDIKSDPVYVHMSSSLVKNYVALKGAPAQFGPNLKDFGKVCGKAIFAIPYDACSDLENADKIKGRIVIVLRGQCMFVTKVKMVEKAGGIGVVIIDNNPDTSFDNDEPFTMAGDDKTHTNIPSVFLFQKEGNMLERTLTEIYSKHASLKIALAALDLPEFNLSTGCGELPHKPFMYCASNNKQRRLMNKYPTCWKSDILFGKMSLEEDKTVKQHQATTKTSLPSYNEDL